MTPTKAKDDAPDRERQDRDTVDREREDKASTTKRDPTKTDRDRAADRDTSTLLNQAPALEPTDRELNAAEQAEADLHAANRKAAQTVTDVPPDHAAPTRRVEQPYETVAQREAGPHRPEPATPRRNIVGALPVLEPAEPRALRGPGIKVMATQTGYYDEKRRRTDDVFDIHSLDDFSDRWMVRVPADTPNRITTGQQAIRRQHDEALAAQASRKSGAAPSRATGERHVLGEED